MSTNSENVMRNCIIIAELPRKTSENLSAFRESEA